MKKTILVALAALVLSACNPNGYVITGQLDKLNLTDSVYLMSTTDREALPLAEAAVDPENGTFEMKGTAERHEAAMLVNKRRQGLGVILLEPGKITVETHPISGLVVKGTPANDAIRVMQDSVFLLEGQLFAAADDPQKQDSLHRASAELTLGTIRQNSDNIAGVFLLNTWGSQFELKQVEELMAGIDPKYAEHPLALEVNKTIEAMRKTEIGQPYMDIALQNTEGQVVAFSEMATGKWVLIDFWASWCQPCLQELPYLKKAYEEYGERGFSIYGVSLDSDRGAWLKCVEAQQMTWTNVNAIDPAGPNPVVFEYGIRTIPANFLISPEGVIVAKQLRGEELLERLAEEID